MSNRSHSRNVGVTLVLAASGMLGLGGCSQSVKTSPTIHSVQMDGSQAHDSTRVAKGETLTLNLPTNTRTQFAWRLAPESAQNGHLELADRRERWNANGELAFGDDPASDVFVFKANKPGTTSLEFIYDCPPGCPQSSMMRMTLDVEVFDAKAEAIAAMQAQKAAEMAAAEEAKKAAEMAAAESQQSAETASVVEPTDVASADGSPE